MISGFVLYRSGYFEAEHAHYALQKSPNGGELNNVSIEQDSTKTDTIRQMNNMPIMPSSKSITPAFNLKKYEQKQLRQEIMPSSKSMSHPIRMYPDLDVELENPYVSSSKSVIVHDFQREIENLFTSSEKQSKESAKKVEPDASKIQPEKLEKATVPALNIEQQENQSVNEEKPDGVSWGMIGLGVLGILFVGIGSILYFKRRSK